MTKHLKSLLEATSDPNLTGLQVRTLLALNFLADENRSIQITKKRLASWLTCDKATVWRSISALEENNYLIKNRQVDKEGVTLPNVYIIGETADDESVTKTEDTNLNYPVDN